MTPWQVAHAKGNNKLAQFLKEALEKREGARPRVGSDSFGRVKR